MPQEYSSGPVHSPDTLGSLQEVFERVWQDAVSVGLIDGTGANALELRKDLARSVFNAGVEGATLQQIEETVFEGLCHQLYAAALAL
jgi:hypothetical protein